MPNAVVQDFIASPVSRTFIGGPVAHAPFSIFAGTHTHFFVTSPFPPLRLRRLHNLPATQLPVSDLFLLISGAQSARPVLTRRTPKRPNPPFRADRRGRAAGHGITLYEYTAAMVYAPFEPILGEFELDGVKI